MKKQEVEFKVGEEILRGSLFIPEGKGPFPGVVFYHGRYSSRERYLLIAKALVKGGIMALAFDFRGCGNSDGIQNEQTLVMGIEDGISALEFLLNQNVDRDRIGIQGTSFGGFVAGNMLNSNVKIKSIALRAPAAYGVKFQTMRETSVGFFNKAKNWSDSTSYKGLKNFKGNILVIESEKDELLSPELVRKYYNIASGATKRTLFIHRNAGHSLSNNPKGLKEFYEITVKWFLETL